MRKINYRVLPALNGPLAGVFLSKQHPNSDNSQPKTFFLHIRFPFLILNILIFFVDAIKNYLIQFKYAFYNYLKY